MYKLALTIRQLQLRGWKHTFTQYIVNNAIVIFNTAPVSYQQMNVLTHSLHLTIILTTALCDDEDTTPPPQVHWRSW